MQPYNYAGAFEGIASPGDSFTQGYKDGVAIRALEIERQKQEAELAKQKQMALDMQSLYDDPTPANIAKSALKYPQFSEQFKRGFDMMDATERQGKLDVMTQVDAALQSNRMDIAKDLMTRQAAGFRNSGKEDDAKSTETMLAVFEKDPQLAKITVGKMLAAVAGPEKYAAAMAALGGEQRAQEQAPDDLRKKKADAGAAESDAQTKAITAKYADSNALLEQQKKGWDVKKIIADIDFQKESNRIAAMNAAANRESNTLKKQELQLKIDDAKLARDEKIREKVAKGESEVTGITDMNNLISTILGDEDSLKAVTGASAWKGSIPGTKNRAVAGKIEQLSNMVGAANLDKITGAMSDKDIAFVKNMSANLDRWQDEDVFESDLKHLQKIAERTEDRARAKHGMPARKPAAPSPDPAADKSVRDAADAILRGGGGNGNR